MDVLGDLLYKGFVRKRLTTTHVADLLHVSEATIKRWADAGVLRFGKTKGGHRRFDIDAISRFHRQQIKSGATTSQSPGRQRGPARTKPAEAWIFRDYLLNAKSHEAELSLIDAYMNGHGPAKLFDSLVTEAMHSIGELWFRGEISIGDEHLASRVMLGALAQLRSVVSPKNSTGLKAVCCGIESDFHEVPTHLATIVLESNGWRATNLGPNTPLYSLCELFTVRGKNEVKGTDLICIAARIIEDLERAARELALLRRVSERAGAKILIGGEAFRDPRIREKFPADCYATCFADLERFVGVIETEKRTVHR